MFSNTQIAISAVVGLVASAIVAVAYARWTRTPISVTDNAADVAHLGRIDSALV
jgi:hypothetical protein